MLKKKSRQQDKPAARSAGTSKKVERSAPAPKSERRVVKAPTPTSRALAKPINFAADARKGQETMSMADFAIPRLTILQDLSPQVQKRDALYIADAEPGDICDVVTGVLYDGNEGITFIPVSYSRDHIEWIPRKKGGGFVANHGADGSIIDKCERGDKGEITTKDGHEIKITPTYFGFLVDDSTGEFSPFVLGMTGSQAKKSRKWNTMINQLRVKDDSTGESFNPAMWYRSYKLATVPENNDQGSWFGWAITPGTNTVDLPQGEKIYRDAIIFREGIQSGKIVATRPAQESDFVAGPPVDDETIY